MRGAVDKLNAARRIGEAIEDAKQDDGEIGAAPPKPGYNELVDENSQGADEENQLAASHIDGYDETLFKDLSENDPLLVERKNLIKAKKELDGYLEKRASEKKKASPQEEAMKASLQKKLLTQQIKFKEE